MVVIKTTRRKAKGGRTIIRRRRIEVIGREQIVTSEDISEIRRKLRKNGFKVRKEFG